MDKQKSAGIAKHTLDILSKGFYKNVTGKTVTIKDEVKTSIDSTILYKPDFDFDTAIKNITVNNYDTKMEFTLETTLKASQRLVTEGFNNVVCLNFASAKNPGGGFLNGMTTQEESLAKASALYSTIVTKDEMYNYNRNLKSGLYSDYMIFSPKVPVFKDDYGNLLTNFHLVSMITSPAVNWTFMKDQNDHKKAPEVMLNRIDKIMKLGLIHNQEAIVVGAFGCGVFKNDPNDVAKYFKQVIESPAIKGQYKKIIFAIIDKQMLDTFKSIIK